MDFGVDYWEELIVPLDNYISKGTPTFLGSTNPNYQESLFTMVEHTLSGACVCVFCSVFFVFTVLDQGFLVQLCCHGHAWPLDT